MKANPENEEKLVISLEVIEGEWFLALSVQPNGEILFMYPFLHFIADNADDLLSQHNGREAVRDLRNLCEGLKDLTAEMRQQITERALGYNTDVFSYEEWNN